MGLFLRFHPRMPRRRTISASEQVAQAQVLGQAQQRHQVPEMGNQSAFNPAPQGVGTGPEPAGVRRLGQPGLLLELLETLGEVVGRDVDRPAVVCALPRHPAGSSFGEVGHVSVAEALYFVTSQVLP